MNFMLITARLAKEPELNEVGGRMVCNLRLVINEYKGAGKEPSATYIDAKCWEQQAKACATHLGKGQQVTIQGQFRSKSWKDDSGTWKNRAWCEIKIIEFGPKPMGNTEPTDEQLGLDEI